MIPKRTLQVAERSFSFENYESTHAVAMVTSGLLNETKSPDREVIEALDAYQQAISRFNSSLRIVGRMNPGIYLRKDLIHSRDPSTWPKKEEEALAEPFRRLLEQHLATMRTMEKAFPWTKREH